MGFIRRYGYFPPNEVIQQIEGVIIVDAPPPGAIDGINTGVVACVGEFADMTGAVKVDTTGAVTTRISAQIIFSGQDFQNKVGGFDETLGDFGGSFGNGYAALRNKRFASLVCVPVNLASARGARLTRDLPLCKSTTDATPVVPVVGASVLAGREFKLGSGRIRLASLRSFTALDVIASGLGGALSNAGSAATQTFAATSGFDWTTIVRPDGSLGARKGDILVIGRNNNGAASPAAEAGTYRVASDPAAGVNISIEKLNGANFTTTAQTDIPWRLHVSTDADTAPERVPGAATPGGYSASEAGGYVVPIRPLTSSAGGATSDGTWTASTNVPPAVVPAAVTGSTWDPLSGLNMRLHPSGTTLFTAALQRINAPASADLDAAYATALDAMLSDIAPQRTVSIIFAARKSANIRSKLKSHAIQASSRGIGRVAVISPDLGVQATATAGGDSDPAVGAQRDEGVIYAWPGAQNFVPEAVGFRLKTAESTTSVDGVLDDPFDSWVASVLSNLATERNPGQTAAPVTDVLAPILGLQRGIVTLELDDYSYMKSRGICALRMDQTVGPVIQSGITTSLVEGRKNINRRRFSYFVQDSMAARLSHFSKLPVNQNLKDGTYGELDAFCSELLSPDNPAAQRIDGYLIDDKSGNTPSMTAKGIHVIIVKIRMTPTADYIVLQAEVGENVVVRVAA